MRIGVVLKTATAAVTQPITEIALIGRRVAYLPLCKIVGTMKEGVMVPLGAVAVEPAAERLHTQPSTQIDGIFIDAILFPKAVLLVPDWVTAVGNMRPEMARR